MLSGKPDLQASEDFYLEPGHVVREVKRRSQKV
jgi:hypothetical protein